MPSVTTIASSTTRPIAIARPPSDMRFSVIAEPAHHRERAEQRERHRDRRDQAGAHSRAARARSRSATARCRSGSRRARWSASRRRARPDRRPGASSTSAGSACARAQAARPPASDAVDDVDRARPGQPRDRDRDRLAARAAHDHVGILRALDDVGDRRQRDRAGRTVRDRQRAELRRDPGPGRRARPAASGADRTRGRRRPRGPPARAASASCDGVRCSGASSIGVDHDLDLAHARRRCSSTPPTPGTRTIAGRTMRSATSRSRRGSVVAALAAC